MNAEKLRSCSVLLLDADGVWFDGFEYRTALPDGTVALSKRRDHQDGQGLSFLRAAGLRVKFVSGESQPLGSIVEKINKLPSVQNGTWAPVEASLGKNGKGDKSVAIEEWLKENSFSWSDCIYIGDDINDYHAMKKVSDAGGLAVAPANATRRILEIADIHLKGSGGHGALREFAEMVLDARGLDERELPPA